MSNYIKQTWVTGDTVQANGPSNNLNHIEDGIANIVESSDSNLSNLNVLVIGDSIAAGQHVSSENKWTTLLANEYNWTLTNKAVPGVPLSDYYNREHSTSEQSIVRQIDYIAQMQTKPDLVICWGGHNDQGGTYRPSPLGSFSDVTTQDTAGVLPTYADRYSLLGAIRYICEVVHNYAPKAAIVF